MFKNFKIDSKHIKAMVFILAAGITAAISKKDEMDKDAKIEEMEQRITLLEDKGDH